MIRLGLVLYGLIVLVLTGGFTFYSTTSGPPPSPATIQDQQSIVLGGVNGIQLVLN